MLVEWLSKNVQPISAEVPAFGSLRLLQRGAIALQDNPSTQHPGLNAMLDSLAARTIEPFLLMVTVHGIDPVARWPRICTSRVGSRLDWEERHHCQQGHWHARRSSSQGLVMAGVFGLRWAQEHEGLCDSSVVEALEAPPVVAQ